MPEHQLVLVEWTSRMVMGIPMPDDRQVTRVAGETDWLPRELAAYVVGNGYAIKGEG